MSPTGISINAASTSLSKSSKKEKFMMKCYPKTVRRRWSVLLIIAFGITFSTLFRYAFLQEHEYGVDGWLYHKMASILINLGYAPWLIHPLSYFGMYPFSDSIGGIIVTGAISLSTNVNIEISTLLYSWMNGVMLFFFGFLLGMTFKRDTLFAAIVGISLTFAPILFRSSIWELSTRVESVSLLVLVPVVLMKGIRLKNKRFFLYLIAVLLTVAAFLTHKLAVFVVIFFVAPLLIWMGQKLMEREMVSRPAVKRILLISTIGTIFGAVLYLKIFIHHPLFTSYESGALLSGKSLWVEMANIAISITGGTGVLLFFAPIGILVLLWKPFRTYTENYFLACIIAVIPFIFIRLYIRPVLPIILVIPIAVGAFTLTKWLLLIDRKKVVSFLMGGVVLAAAPAFALFMTNHWREGYPEYTNKSPTPSVVASAIFFERGISSEENTFVASNPLMGLQVSAYTQWKDLPAHPWFAVFYGLFGQEDIDPVWSGMGSYLYKSNLEKTILGDYYYRLMGNPVSSEISQKMIEKYSIRYVLQDKKLDDQMLWFSLSKTHPSMFLTSLPDNSYTIYENKRVIIWLI